MKMNQGLQARGIARAYKSGQEQVKKLIAAQKGIKLPPPKKNVTTAQPEAIPQPLKVSAPPVKGKQLVTISHEVQKATTLFDTTEVAPGQVLRQVGEIFRFNNTFYEVTLVKQTSAQARKISRSVKSADEITISSCRDIADVVTADNINKQTNETSNMKKQTETILTGIDLLISKTIASKKDDNKIAAMCLSNYPEVPPADVVKLIAKYRKAAAKGVTIGKTQTAAPVKVAKAPKAEGRPQTPSAEHPWAGCGAAERKLIDAGVAPQDAFKKLAKVYLKMTPGSFAADWARFTGKAKPNMDGVKCPPRGFGDQAAVPAPKKAPVASKTPAPKPKAPAPKKVAPVAEVEADIPAEGKEVPQE